jgi:anti-sigma B factor antagonist
VDTLRFDHESRGGFSIVRVHGDVDTSTAPSFASAVAAPGRPVVDLTDCQYMDSSGLAVLIGKHNLLGGSFPIVTPDGSFFRKLFRVAGIERLFVLFETVEDAISAQSEPDANGPPTGTPPAIDSASHLGAHGRRDVWVLSPVTPCH